MRKRILPFALVVLAAFGAGCLGDEGAGWGRGENEILFGISQRTHAPSGASEVVAGYEFLRLANHGGWATTASRAESGSCYFERFDRRLGRLRVESGVATWTGGALPPSGLQVIANEPEAARHEGPGWATGETLTLEVSGFAMPEIGLVTMRAPRAELEITSVAPTLAEGATELSITETESVGVSWAPREDRGGHVLVSLSTEEPDGRGGNVRCFASASSGDLVVPARWVTRLFSSVDPETPIAGTLEIASHQQVTVRAPGGWAVYVVATTVHYEQRFTGVRDEDRAEDPDA